MDEREGFEKFLKESGAFKRFDQEYKKPLIDIAWVVWQSAIQWERERADGEVDPCR